MAPYNPSLRAQLFLLKQQHQPFRLILFSANRSEKSALAVRNGGPAVAGMAGAGRERVASGRIAEDRAGGSIAST